MCKRPDRNARNDRAYWRLVANSNPPIKNQAFTTYVTLNNFSSPGSFKSNPTIASGDWKISKDGGAFANLTNLPSVEPSSSVSVKLDLTNTEMNADSVMIVGIDQTAPKEWADFALTILTTAA